MGPLDKFALRLVLLTFLLGKGKFSLLQEYQCLEVCTSESLSQPLTIPEKLIICLVQCQRTTKLVSHWDKLFEVFIESLCSLWYGSLVLRYFDSSYDPVFMYIKYCPTSNIVLSRPQMIAQGIGWTWTKLSIAREFLSRNWINGIKAWIILAALLELQSVLSTSLTVAISSSADEIVTSCLSSSVREPSNRLNPSQINVSLLALLAEDWNESMLLRFCWKEICPWLSGQRVLVSVLVLGREK